MSEIAVSRPFRKGGVPSRALTIQTLGLNRHLPARLRDLTDEARAAVGTALDQGSVRFGLDQDGSVLVLRRGARP